MSLRLIRRRRPGAPICSELTTGPSASRSVEALRRQAIRMRAVVSAELRQKLEIDRGPATQSTPIGMQRAQPDGGARPR